MTRTFLLIDAHAVIYRAFYAIPDLTTRDGMLINAVYGFTRILLNVLHEFEPEYVAIAFDSKEKTLRAQEFTDYKANRAEMPDTLIPQIDLVKKVVDALNIPRFEQAGFEADDLIGTLSRHVADHHSEIDKILIVTGDRDLLQLVNDKIHVFIPSRNSRQADTEYDASKVKETMGVNPTQIIDLKALMGDASDNVPGVTGVGKKTAVKLIQTFGSLQALYQTVDQLESGGDGQSRAPWLKGALLQKLIAGKESAFLSQKLVTIDTRVKLDFDLPACRLSGYDKDQVMVLFEELEFHSLGRLLPKDDFELGLQAALF